MSTTLNFNKHKYYSWKDKTFSQVTSSIKKNIGTIPQKYNNITNYFLANPLKIYRREIATSQISCNSRTSVKIDELNRPNGYLVYNSTNTTGINMPLDLNLINSKYELNTPMCNNSLSCFNPASNALKRVRSSGMIPKKFNLGLNNDQYCTNTNQYLTSRNKTFQQNQYNYLKYGNNLSIPGTLSAENNVYSAQGMNHCKKCYISVLSGNNTFKYNFINGTEYPVTIADGYYDIISLNGQFQNTMMINGHYFTDTRTGGNVFIMSITYDYIKNSIKLHSERLNEYNQLIINGSLVYTTTSDNTNGWRTSTLNRDKYPQFMIPDGFGSVVGFTYGSYPSSQPATVASYNVMSNRSFSVNPGYIPIVYKPNNSQFAQQGAVDSSALISRLKYDTITGIGSKIRSPSGNQITNTLAYAVPNGTFSKIKKEGKPFPLKSTPTFCKFNKNKSVIMCKSV